MLDALNEMARSPINIAVTELAMVNEKAGQEPVVPESIRATCKEALKPTGYETGSLSPDMLAHAGAEQRSLEDLAHHERLALGKELVTVRMELDVYRVADEGKTN